MLLSFPNAPRRLVVLLLLYEQFAMIDSFHNPTGLTKQLNTGHFDTHLSMAPDQNQGLSPGKVMTTRYLHRFSPTKSPVQSSYTIEERQKFHVGKKNKLEPIGDRSLIFRGGVGGNDEANPLSNGSGSSVISIGPALYNVEGLQVGDGDSSWESTYAMALYCMKYPEIFEGKGLELKSGSGVAGIMSVIGAGLASSSGFHLNDVIAPTPENFATLLMTDSDKDVLNLCIDNLGAIRFPEPKIELGLLDWNRQVQDDMKDQFDFIIGCDCLHDTEQLAKTLAHALKRPPKDISTQSSIGTFVHVGPENRGKTGLLQRELGDGYRMNAISKDMVLERIQLMPVLFDSIEDAEVQMKNEIVGDIGGLAQFAAMETKIYSALVGYHEEASDTMESNEKDELAQVEANDGEVTLEGLKSFENTAMLFANTHVIGVSNDDRIRSAYLEWTDKYEKDTDESRYSVFASNYLSAEELVSDYDKGIQLNEWFDRTDEEYIVLNTKKAIAALADLKVEEIEVGWHNKQIDMFLETEESTGVELESIKIVEPHVRKSRTESKEAYSLMSESAGGNTGGEDNSPLNLLLRTQEGGDNGSGMNDSLDDAFESILGKKPDSVGEGPASNFDGKNPLIDEVRFAAEVEEFLKKAEEEKAAEAEEIAKATAEAKKTYDAAVAKASGVTDTKEGTRTANKLKKEQHKSTKEFSKSAGAQEVSNKQGNDTTKSDKPKGFAMLDTIIDGAKRIANAAADANARARERARVLQKEEIEKREREMSAKKEMDQRMLLISRLNMETAEKLTHARVYAIYLEWCGVYEKQVNQSRFNMFKSNFLSMEALADERGTSMQLSKWYDCTEEEYLVQSGKETATEVLADDDEFEDEVYADVIDADVTQAEHGIIEETVEDVNLSHETELRRKQMAVVTELNQRSILIARLEMESMGREKRQEAKEKDTAYANLLVSEKAKRKESAAIAEMKQRSLLAARFEIEKVQRKRMAHVRTIYHQWCNVYDKQADESRFRLFSSNFLSMEALANKRGKSIQLNKYYDLTEVEYRDAIEEEAEIMSEEETRTIAEVDTTVKAEEEAILAVENEAEVIAEEETKAIAKAGLKQMEAMVEMRQRSLLAARLQLESHGRQKRYNAFMDRKQEANQRSILIARLEMESMGREKRFKEAREGKLQMVKDLEDKAKEEARLVKDAQKMERSLEAIAEMKQRSLLASRLEIEKVQRKRMAHVKTIYHQWCNVYDKQADESRFRLFSSNFLSMEALANKRGKSIQLNKYYDLTEVEYRDAIEEESSIAEEEARVAAEEEEEARVAAEEEEEARVAAEEEEKSRVEAEEEEEARVEAKEEARIAAEEEARLAAAEEEEARAAAEVEEEARVAAEARIAAEVEEESKINAEMIVDAAMAVEAKAEEEAMADLSVKVTQPNIIAMSLETKAEEDSVADLSGKVTQPETIVPLHLLRLHKQRGSAKLAQAESSVADLSHIDEESKEDAVTAELKQRFSPDTRVQNEAATVERKAQSKVEGTLQSQVPEVNIENEANRRLFYNFMYGKTVNAGKQGGLQSYEDQLKSFLDTAAFTSTTAESPNVGSIFDSSKSATINSDSEQSPPSKLNTHAIFIDGPPSNLAEIELRAMEAAIETRTEAYVIKEQVELSAESSVLKETEVIAIEKSMGEHVETSHLEINCEASVEGSVEMGSEHEAEQKIEDYNQANGVQRGGFLQSSYLEHISEDSSTKPPTRTSTLMSSNHSMISSTTISSSTVSKAKLYEVEKIVEEEVENSFDKNYFERSMEYKAEKKVEAKEEKP